MAFAALFLSTVLAPGSAGPLRIGTVVILAVYTLVSRAGGQRAGRILLALAAVGELRLLEGIARSLDPSGWGWIFAGSVLGGLLFGSVLSTMNLGHWYLVARSLPLSLLFRAALGYAMVCIARAAFLALAAAFRHKPDAWESLTSLDRDGLFFLFRILWGILGPLALSYFIFQTSKMRSNQAATGLLYVALVFVLIGELLSAYLTVLTRFPA